MDIMNLSKYIITKRFNSGHPVSNAMLQALLYSIQEEYLSIFSTIFDEDFEAWMIGPVVPAIYKKFQCFGVMQILWTFPDIVELPESDKIIIDHVLTSPANQFWGELHYKITQQNSAWNRIYCNGNGEFSVIPKELIQKYIKK